MPEKLREAFSMGVDELEEGSYLGEDYVNGTFVDDVITLPPETLIVSFNYFDKLGCGIYAGGYAKKQPSITFVIGS